ncbi:Protein RETICULATA-related 4, chloroplastic [Vitis vinifera]|uniref:Protein RETICULATA-related 4, chloroplastic n=1 Tax=Vitis vinifera TaxID=29760 RepID=A0A438IKV1_VITVI|nr:Protein RETICULATA-related 4, chloroplastic [Vitis vinifera]
MPLFSGGGGGGINGMGNSGGGSGGDDDVVGGGGGHDDKNNKKAAVLVLAEMGRSLESVPKDLAAAIESGKIPAAIVEKYLELEKSAVFRWLLQFGGFRERLLADDLFLAKVAMECGVGIFTKCIKWGIPLEEYMGSKEACQGAQPVTANARMCEIRIQFLLLVECPELYGPGCNGHIHHPKVLTAAEYERRRENFFKELDFVIADVFDSCLAPTNVDAVMAIIADFMLVWLPAPTVSLRPPLAVSAGAIAKFFHSCPENAFQVALAGTSFSFLQRIGAIVRNGSKLFAVGTTSSLVGTLVTNAIINARKAVDSSSAGEVEDVPVLSTSVAYGGLYGNFQQPQIALQLSKIKLEGTLRTPGHSIG